MKNLKGFIFAILSSTTFGLIPLLALPVLNSGMAMHSVLSYRFILSAILMLFVALYKKADLRVSLKQFAVLSVLGFLYGATALLLLQAYTMIPTGIATTIHFLYPLIVSLIMIFMFHEKGGRGIIFATLLSLAGVAALSWNATGAISISGLLVALSTIFTYATYIVGVQKSSVSHMNEYSMTFYILFTSAMMFCANSIAQGGIEPIGNLEDAGNLLMLALFPTVVSDLTLILAIKYIGPTMTSILGCMEPLTAVVIGIMVFSEPFGLRIVLGISLILIAVTMVIITQARKKKEVQTI